MADERNDLFASTHWSVIVAARSGEAEPEKAHQALAELCQTYWTPLYTFVRTRGYSVHDAQDLTQSFFARFHRTGNLRARPSRPKGRFRAFLLAALKNFLADEYSHSGHRAEARRRQSKFLPLDEARVEAAGVTLSKLIAQMESFSEDRLFERSWAEALVQASLARLAAEYGTEGKARYFPAAENLPHRQR